MCKYSADCNKQVSNQWKLLQTEYICGKDLPSKARLVT